MDGEELFFTSITCFCQRFGSCWLKSEVQLPHVLTEKEGLQSLPPGDILDALYLTPVVAGLLKVDLQVILQVLLVFHVLDVIHKDGSLRRATEGLKRTTNISFNIALRSLLHSFFQEPHEEIDIDRLLLLLWTQALYLIYFYLVLKGYNLASEFFMLTTNQ